LNADVLRSRFARHAQLSWLALRQEAHNICILARSLVLSWRASVIANAGFAVVVRSEILEQRCTSLRRCLENLSRYNYLQVLARQTVAAWHCEARAALEKHAGEIATGVASARLSQAELRIAKLRKTLAGAWQVQVLEKAFLGLWLVSQAQAQEARCEKIRSVEQRSLVDRTHQLIGRVFHATLEVRLHMIVVCLWQAWTCFCSCSFASSAREALEAKMRVATDRNRLRLLRLGSWGFRKVDLQQAFASWVRHIYFSPDNKRELERRLHAECNRYAARQTALLSDVGDWLLHREHLQLLGVFLLTWQRDCQMGRRAEAQHHLSIQEALKKMRSEHALAWLMNSASSVQAAFVSRACFTAWRDLGPVQRAHAGDKQLKQLQATHSRLYLSRLARFESAGSRMRLVHSCAYALIAWITWRRLRRDNCLVRDLEILHVLLLRYQDECQRRQAYESTNVLLQNVQLSYAMNTVRSSSAAPNSAAPKSPAPRAGEFGAADIGSTSNRLNDDPLEPTTIRLNQTRRLASSPTFSSPVAPARLNEDPFEPTTIRLNQTRRSASPPTLSSPAAPAFFSPHAWPAPSVEGGLQQMVARHSESQRSLHQPFESE
jgi:hypothetical protein